MSNSFDNENSINDIYGNILSNQIFIDEPINSKDPDKTASDNEITINSVNHHLLDSITSVENLNLT